MILLNSSPWDSPELLKYLLIAAFSAFIAIRVYKIVTQPSVRSKPRKKIKKKKGTEVLPYEKYLKNLGLLKMGPNRFQSPLFSGIFPKGVWNATLTSFIIVIIISAVNNSVIKSVLILILANILLRPFLIIIKYFTNKEFNLILHGIYHDNESYSVGNKLVANKFFKEAIEINPRLFTCYKYAWNLDAIGYEIDRGSIPEERNQEIVHWLSIGIENSDVISTDVLKERAWAYKRMLLFEESEQDLLHWASINRIINGQADWYLSELYFKWGRYLFLTGRFQDADSKLDLAIKHSQLSVKDAEKERFYRHIYSADALCQKGKIRLQEGTLEEGLSFITQGFDSYFNQSEKFDHYYLENGYIIGDVERIFKTENDFNGLEEYYENLTRAAKNKKVKWFCDKLVKLYLGIGALEKASEYIDFYNNAYPDKLQDFREDSTYKQYKDCDIMELSNKSVYFLDDLMKVGLVHKAEALALNKAANDEKDMRGERLESIKRLVLIYQTKWEHDKALNLCDQIIEEYEDKALWFYAKLAELLVDRSKFDEAYEIYILINEKGLTSQMDNAGKAMMVEVLEKKTMYIEAADLAKELGLISIESNFKEVDPKFSKFEIKPYPLKKVHRINPKNRFSLSDLEWKAMAQQHVTY